MVPGSNLLSVRLLRSHHISRFRSFMLFFLFSSRTNITLFFSLHIDGASKTVCSENVVQQNFATGERLSIGLSNCITLNFVVDFRVFCGKQKFVLKSFS